MDIMFLGIIVFLFALAIFDLSVGVSNDAVNFLNSAIGSKAASFKKIIIIASIGVFIGAVMSNGMMDIARHGIFRPEQFSFYDLICIFMAVMVTDIILLDVFNTLGMPTSTTVSMVFELLGATFAVALYKMAHDGVGLGLADYLNTGKALSVIIGIFLSVAIAFVFGTIVQFITRAFFSFNFKKNLTWKIGIFGGLATTAIIYFMLIKGAKDLTFMTPDIKLWIKTHTLLIIGACFVVFSILMQILHWCKVSVLKTVVLIGTFSLAMAFAGNDLVNFIGVPLSGLASFQDYTANGAGDPNAFMMSSLNSSANTPLIFLFCAGLIMVISLATSKKAQNVSKTEIGLGSQSSGDELFGSSSLARSIVRMSLSVIYFVKRHTPQGVRRWLGRRFNVAEMQPVPGAAFDLVRGSVNLMLAGMLIAFGTSMKLPLSTTFVTFMVAMGTSLADRAWGRESAVFRITGVISVIGGWFITAGVAFIGAAIVASLMHLGGNIVIFIAASLAIIILIRSNRQFKKKNAETKDDCLFQSIITTPDKEQAWDLLKIYLAEQHKKYVAFASVTYHDIADAFVNENIRQLNKSEKALLKEKVVLKAVRRRETLCFSQVPIDTAIEKSAWFHLSNNSCMSMNYNLRRITEVCKEHVGNNFHPLPAIYRDSFEALRADIEQAMSDAIGLIGSDNHIEITALRRRCDNIKDNISEECNRVHDNLRDGNPANLTVSYVYLNLLQESQEMMSGLRKLLRASGKIYQKPDTDDIAEIGKGIAAIS